MVNEFEWAIETPLPPLREGGKFIIDKHSTTNSDITFKDGEHIIFEVISFGIGCISSPLYRSPKGQIYFTVSGDNIGKEVMNFEIIENTQEEKGMYKVGYYGEIQIERAEELVEQDYWQPYEEV
jgi:hypothetical protein